MQKIIIFILALAFSSSIWGQNPSLKIENPYKKNNQTDNTSILTGKTDEEQVAFIVEELFAAMHDADSNRVKSLFSKNAKLMSTSFDDRNSPIISEVPIQSFITNIGRAQKGLLTEEIFNTEIRIDDNLATVWTDYNLFVGDKFSHCGVDAFQLFKGISGWQIIHVSDTRRTEGCQENPGSEIDNMLDAWHAAAASADANTYFGAFTEDGVFLGTDPTEKWSREEFRSWASSAFKKNSAWDFKPSDRQVTMYEDNKLAWFEETLDTWMGKCRGSGVLALTDQGWKIKQYNLAILVPNEKVKDYLNILGQ